mgnify:FL=1
MKKDNKLFKMCIWVLALLFVGILPASNIYAENGDVSESYIIPESNSRYLEESELTNLSLQILNYAKNEIYAREGRIFRSEELRTYFEQQSWYQGTVQPDVFDDKTMLNQYEYANAQLISGVEHKINPDGYQVDQAGYSYEPVYQYIANRNTENTGMQSMISAKEYQFIGGGSVQTVSFEEQYVKTEEGMQYMYGDIKGVDAENKTVWERKTDQYICADCAPVWNIGEHGKFYYYEEGGKVVKLDKEKGEIQWEVDARATVPMAVFGSDETLYLCCSFYEAPDFSAISKDGTLLNQINNITGDHSEATSIRYLGSQIAITCYEEYGNTIYLIDLNDFSYHKREYDERLDWYGGIYDFTEYEEQLDSKIIQYADEDIDGDDVTELITCSKDDNKKEEYYIWKKDQDMPIKVPRLTGEQEEAPIKALYFYSDNGLLVVYNEKNSMQTYSFYSIEESELKLNYCIYQKKEGMKKELYFYQAYSEYIGGETNRRIKMLEYGMDNDENKKAAGIIWKGYIDKLSKFEFKKA